ncbi:hypothetical protein A4D02_15650 [Niastella koreensis]|uniref:DUF4959 domain-containing protein n=2 Tax=Niastella koreensis TaxID=354356 RepID=G8TQU3_NIAKG|nr:DUF5000 domain-containing lipoprotein [Niastella koreensis]AEV97842.1 hypothetical protein Niako_1471 [Niastella koreensis GR20-10]OQP40350.1 hypothetical protein A4D02_15650 [Niastella koreensis]
MKKHMVVIAALLLLTAVWSCKKEDVNGIKQGGGSAPGVVSNVTVVNEHGAATISYVLPGDEDLLYIKAVYTLPNGTQREVKASYYSNQLRVDGFADTLKHTVKLYAMNRAEEAGQPVEVEIAPLVSHIQLVYRNMTVRATAGGIRVLSQNPYKGDVVIVPMVDSLETGEWKSLDNIYTSDSIIAVSIRGLSPSPKKFAFCVRDRWLNHTDTMYATLTPKRELSIDKNDFAVYQCDNDTKMSYSTTVDLMWKGLMSNEWPCTYTDESSGIPTTITWSVGSAPVKLTRFNLLTRREGSLWYSKGSPRRFEIYGSNSPTHDGDWSKWTKILSCEVIKPSGLPLGTENNADNTAGSVGFAFDFNEDTPPYQYLRLKCLQNWMGSYFIEIENMSMWKTN